MNEKKRRKQSRNKVAGQQQQPPALETITENFIDSIAVS